MYLSRVYIKNYRSIKELDLKLSPGKNVLIGRNNSGKSNIVKAIDLVLNEYSPDFKRSQSVTVDDFYTEDKTTSEYMIIWCEISQDPNRKFDITTLAGHANGYYKYNHKQFDLSEMEKEIQEAFSIEMNSNNRSWMRTDEHFGDGINELNTMSYFAYALVCTREGGIVTDKTLRMFYRKNENSKWHMAFYAPFRNSLLQSALIPSFRDPASQLKLNSWSWYGKLMQHLTKDVIEREDLKNALESISIISNEIFQDLTEKVSRSSIKTSFPGTTLHFQFNTENRTDFYKSATIYVDDGHKSQLSEKGSGIQSAVIIGLFTYYTKEVNVEGSALLCIEEPELFLHPHGRRVINKQLDNFVSMGNNQVLLTTHNVEFINSADNSNIIVIRKNENGTEAFSLNSKSLQELLIDNNQNEVLFSDRVIICEGFDKYVIEEVAEHYFPGKLDEKNISVISVGGKDAFSKMVKCLNSLQIPIHVFADFDYLLRDKNNKGNFDKAKCHESVEHLGTHYFNQKDILLPIEESVLGDISKLRSKLREYTPEFFYLDNNINDCDDESLKIEIIDLLNRLRLGGTCILQSQIEDLFNDNTYFERNKLDLKNIYKLKKDIREGKSIDTLMDTREISKFLAGFLCETENNSTGENSSNDPIDYPTDYPIDEPSDDPLDYLSDYPLDYLSDYPLDDPYDALFDNGEEVPF